MMNSTDKNTIPEAFTDWKRWKQIQIDKINVNNTEWLAAVWASRVGPKSGEAFDFIMACLIQHKYGWE